MKQKIFIDCTMHLGDMIMTSSLLPVLKKAYPDSEIHYMTQSKLAEIVELFPSVDKVLPYTYKSKRNYLDIYRFAKKLKLEKYDIGIAIEPKRRTSIMKWLARIPIRISLEQIWERENKKKRIWYTHEAQISNWDLTQHLLSESAFEIVKRTFSIEDLKYSYPTLIPSSAEEKYFVDTLLANNNVHDDNLSIVFSVRTVDQHRNWEPKKFAELGDWLIEKYNASIIFAGIPDDEETVTIIRNEMRYGNKTINFIGKTNIKEAVALFRKIKLLITLDTGMGHLAGAAGCRIVSIFGNTNSKRFAPAGEKVAVVTSPERSIETVTVQMVQNAIMKLVNI